MSDVARYWIRTGELLTFHPAGSCTIHHPVVLAADYDRDTRVLKEQLAAMTSKRDAIAQAVDRIAKERDALTARLAACREALERYGKHHTECCCGLDKALAQEREG